MAIRSRGKMICADGKLGGILRLPVLGSRGAEDTRYMRPVMAAKADCTVLRKMAYWKRALVGPWVVVVRRSWRYAQLRLREGYEHT
jgi:hypothetical protein